jgi:hypothetical protein
MSIVHCSPPTLPNNPTGADLTYFVRKFENYLTITDAKENHKLPLLLNSLGRDGLNVYDGLNKPKDTYATAIDRLKEYFIGSSSILLKRKIFLESRQEVNETITSYACRLGRLIAECNFTNSAELLRDIFVIGVKNDRLGERLLTEDASKLTFDEAVAKATAVERA